VLYFQFAHPSVVCPFRTLTGGWLVSFAPAGQGTSAPAGLGTFDPPRLGVILPQCCDLQTYSRRRIQWMPGRLRGRGLSETAVN
jgi:hypothetical protein